MISCFSTALIGAIRSLLFHSVICSLGSPVVVFFGRGHPRFWNFYSTIPVDVVRVKSYINCLFDPIFFASRTRAIKLQSRGHKPMLFRSKKDFSVDAFLADLECLLSSTMDMFSKPYEA